MQIKKGDIVGRYSYNSDILFYVDKIIKLNRREKIAVLKGLNIRIEADAPIRRFKKVCPQRGRPINKRSRK